MGAGLSATALVVVDVQDEFVAPLDDAAALLGALGTLVAAAREAGALVVHVRDRSSDSASSIDVRDGEPVVDKAVDDAFDGTDLADLLAGHEVVAVGGIQSEMCVAATARGAMARGLTVVLPHDAHATYDVPADATGPAIPADVVRRVAVWSLGSDLVAPPTSTDVHFR